ncbi:hypothetical protein LM592_02365 [Candidatus Acetothermia bacterium]|jgi:predicted transcriptional regulator|nr:hypothetical protein [Candidatus Acetothermia bacterium]MCI2428087.1 hypothetical protein [Candidatus Acetothermia bacterium]
MKSYLRLQLLFLLSQARLGRRSLAKLTGFPELTVRRELERLREQRIIDFSKDGAMLSDHGKEQYRSSLAAIGAVKDISLQELALDQYSVAAILHTQEIKPTWQYRDLAIKEGATAVLFIRCGSKGLHFADSCDKLATKNPRDSETIAASFICSEDDLIIIVFAQEKTIASQSLWRVIDAIIC